KLKQGYLQQLFPSKDKYLPRLRFKEFNGDWKQCTMGEIFTERTERSGEGELISVTINSGVVKASELDRKDNSSKNKSNYKKVEIGDIAYNSMRMWQGASGYSPYKGILSPAYTVITPKNEIDSKFFAYDFKRFNMIQAFKRNSQGLTSDTWNLKFPTLKSIKINVPHFDEQRRISNTFNQVDNMLLLQQTKIDQLNKLKQAYLQKLFP
ncbi:restriction endonuclease subunit S, partial [Latilactobacillus curvatus]|uniref:restriction endonuclease subunit S n=1 Tax=Latilactobacillus curvatus TaxID=28038 RepID=UPI0021AED486